MTNRFAIFKRIRGWIAKHTVCAGDCYVRRGTNTYAPEVLYQVLECYPLCEMREYKKVDGQWQREWRLSIEWHNLYEKYERAAIPTALMIINGAHHE